MHYQIVATLESVASALETRGMKKWAMELDKVSNTIDADPHPLNKMAGLLMGQKGESALLGHLSTLHTKKANIDQDKTDLSSSDIIEELHSSALRISKLDLPALTWAYTLQDLFSRADESSALTRKMHEVGSKINKDMHSQAKKLMTLKNVDPALRDQIVEDLKTMLLGDLDPLPEIRSFVTESLGHGSAEVTAASASPEGIQESHIKGVVEDIRKDLEAVGGTHSMHGIETQSLISNLYQSLMDLVHYCKQEPKLLERYRQELLGSTDVKDGLARVGDLLKGMQFSDKHRTITKLMGMVDPQLANLMNNHGQETPIDQS